MNKDILQVGTVIKIDTVENTISFRVEKIEIRHTQLFHSEWVTWVVGKHANFAGGEISNLSIKLDDLVASLNRYYNNSTYKVEFQQPDEEID